MISSIKHKQSISWTFLNDAMAFSAKEMPKNHTDKERVAAALSCIQTGILTFLFPLKRRRSSPSPFISHRIVEAVASWILKSLLPTIAWRSTPLKGNYKVACRKSADNWRNTNSSSSLQSSDLMPWIFLAFLALFSNTADWKKRG